MDKRYEFLAQIFNHFWKIKLLILYETGEGVANPIAQLAFRKFNCPTCIRKATHIQNFKNLESLVDFKFS
jgi:hypothetical protein